MIGIVLALIAFFATAKADYTTWKQYDSKWGDKKLGNGGTMSKWGCKITSIAILMAHSNAESRNEGSFNPGVLRDRYENGGFVQHGGDCDGCLYASATTKANSPKFYKEGVKDFAAYSFSYVCTEITKLLNNGYYVEVRVKNNGHSVAVKSATNSAVTIMDPGSGSITQLSSYTSNIYSGNYYRRG